MTTQKLEQEAQLFLRQLSLTSKTENVGTEILQFVKLISIK